MSKRQDCKIENLSKATAVFDSAVNDQVRFAWSETVHGVNKLTRSLRRSLGVR
jgi:hypothetical protein